MAITIDWATAVININQADMLLVQSSPSIIYQLDMEQLRLALKDLEDDVQGINWPVTHSRNAPVTISGAVLAQVIEILPPYTLSFEEVGTPYRVNIVGANSNAGDRTNLGSGEVSVSTSNSAGLQDLNSLQIASFDGGVTVDVTSNFQGTQFPNGTRANPVNTLSDAISIAMTRGLHVIYVASDLTIGAGINLGPGFEFIGNGKTHITITLDAAATISNSLFRNVTIQGTLDNDNKIIDCIVLDLFDNNGFIENCELSGTVEIGGGTLSSIVNCYSGFAGGGPDDTAIVDMGGSGQPLVMRGYKGGIKLINKTGTDKVSIDMESGQLVVDSTVTTGDIVVRGICKVTDNSTGTATVDTEGVVNDILSRGQFISTNRGI